MLYLLYFILFLLTTSIIVFTSYQIYTIFLQPGAFYYPTTDLAVKQILEISKLSSKDTLIDIGSGDGRILIAAARLGITSIGYEIDPFLVRKSRRLVHQANLDKLVTVHWKSFWKADFNQASVITIYLFPRFMNRLQKLIEKKIKHPIKLITNDYPFTQLKPVKQSDRIFLYHLNKEKSPNNLPKK